MSTFDNACQRLFRVSCHEILADGWHALRYSEGRAERHRLRLLQQTREPHNFICMRIVNLQTGKAHIEKRRVRYNEPGQPRELTWSCFRRYPFLSRERTCQWLCEALDEARTEYAFQLWAYVVMPEHVHVLVYPGEAPQLMSRFLQAVKEPVARKAIRYLKSSAPNWIARVTVREGPRLRRRFWQPGGGYDRNITSAKVLRAAIDYIHANPVRRGLVSTAEDWQWSSARWYAGFRPVTLEMDQSVLSELARE